MTVWCSRSRLTKLRLGQALGHGFGGLVVLRLLVLLRGEVGGAPAGAEGESARRQLDQRVYVGVVGVVDLRRVEGLTDLAVLCEAGGCVLVEPGVVPFGVGGVVVVECEWVLLAVRGPRAIRGSGHGGAGFGFGGVRGALVGQDDGFLAP